MPLVLVLSSPPCLDTVKMRGQHCSMEKEEWITLLGLVAGTLTTLSFLPQLLKAWKSRSTHDIFFGMLALFSAGLVL